MSSRFSGRSMNKAMPGLAALLAVTGGAAHAQSESTAQGAGVEEIVVTGSRIARDGLTAPTPVTVVSEARLENLGATNIGQVLNTLPAFRATSNPQTSNIQPRNAGMIQADLRGLGPNRTLVLVNGRRFTPSTQEGTVDLNQIPTLLIERTEVVTGGASAAYGSDAVAGVVNLILKDDLEGVRTQIQYGQTEESDNETLNVGVAAGTAFAGGRGHVSVALEYEDNKGTGDCYTRDWCAQEYQVVTNTGAARIASLPANNILARTHTVNAVVGGLVLSGPAAGTTFNADGTPRPYQYGQVFPTNPTFMVGGEGYNGFIGAPLMVVPVERSNVFVQSKFDFTDNLTGRVEASYGQMEANGRGAQTRDFLAAGGSAITMRGDNPFIPAAMRTTLTNAGQPLTPATSFTFGRMGDDFGYTQNETGTDVYRALVGLDGSLGDWTWDAYYQFGKTEYEQTIRNNRIQQQTVGVPLAAGLTPGGATISCANTPAACSRIQLAADVTTHPVTNQPVCRITLTDPTNPCVPVNLFGVNRYSQAAYDYLYGTGYLTNDLEQHVIAASIQGDLFETAAGVVPLAAGIEYRSNEVSTTADPISGSSGFYVFNSTIVNGKVEVKEAFAETVVPVLRDVTGVRSLELNGAVRLTDYTTSGEVTTWKIGTVYEPSEWFRLRATRSRDIRAPNTDELFRPQTSGFVTIDGVLRTQITGGNTNLVPEEADTVTVGIGLTGFGWAEGFRASIDYYQIEIQDAISTLTAQTIVNRCRSFGTYCDQVTFETPGNPATPPSVVRVLFQNLNQLEVNGIDFEINYNLPTSFGTWDFNLLATYLDELKTTDATGTAIDRAGVTGNNVSGGGAGLPEWQANALVSYNIGNLTVTAEGRYIDDGLFDATLIGPEQIGYSVTLPNSINTNHVDSRFYMNLGARYAFELGNDMNLELFGGVRNVFDKDPPVAPSNQGSSNLILFDPLGRAYQVGVRVDF